MEGVASVEPFRIHVADEVLDDLQARLRRTRWPDQVAGIGWKQGTELGWLRHLVSYWTREFDWRIWEQRLNTLDHFTWDGIHFDDRPTASGRGRPPLLTRLESDVTPIVDDAELSDVERSYLAVNRGWDATERGYSAMQSTKPQTIGYGLNDSPAGLAAYVGEKWQSWSDVTPPDDFLCATLTLYWVTRTITSSMRDYCDNRWYPVDRAYVGTPTAFGVFADQSVSEGEPPRPYLERVYNIQRWTVFPHGGHFAPAEEPAAVAGDLITFFRDLN